MTRLVLLLVLGNAGLAWPAPPGAEPDVVIRMYQRSGVSPLSAVELQHAITRLLEGVEFRVAITDCLRLPCGYKLASNELALRLLAGRDVDNPSVCGMAVPGRGEPGILMTVYRDCVAETTRDLHALALRQGLPDLRNLAEADVLAPIVLHEVIHLLLPEEAHGAGLFKGELHLGDWMDAADRLLALEPAMATRLRAAAADRAAQAGGH